MTNLLSHRFSEHGGHAAVSTSTAILLPHFELVNGGTTARKTKIGNRFLTFCESLTHARGAAKIIRTTVIEIPTP